MKNIQITEENKHIVRKYYVSLYKICLNDYGIYTDETYDEVNNYVDKKTCECLNESKSFRTFAKYVATNNYIRRKYNISFISPKEKVELIKQGNYKYRETLIEFYKIRLEYNISMLDLNSRIENKEKIIRDGNLLIERAIEKYFDEKSNRDFNIYMTQVLKQFYFKHGIKKFSGEDAIVIDNINDINKDKEKLYDIYYSLAKRRIKNIVNLPKDKFELFLKLFVKEKINLYFENGKKESFLRNYMENYMRKTISSDIKLLVEYNIFFSDYYNKSILYINNKTNILIDEFIKKHNISSITLKWKLKKESLHITKSYLDKCIANNKYYLYEQNVSGKLKKILATETKVKEFDDFNIELARNGNMDDKKIEFEILLKELSYLKELYKNKHVYYEDISIAEEKINNDYYRIIKSFIYDVLDGEFKKNYKTYISNRLNEALKHYSKSTKNSFYKKGLFFEFNEYYNKIVNNYITKNNLFGEEMFIFVKYMENAFRNYIDSGPYDIDIRWYMKNIIDCYDYEASKQLLAVKEYENANIKVLKRPNVK